MRINRLLLSLVFLTTSAMPQRSALSPPNSPADTASLEVTMKSIQDNLNAVGNVHYAAHWHDYVDDTDGATQYSFEESNVVASPASCWIKYHLKFVAGTALNDRDNGIFLPDVQDLVVTTGEQYANKHYVASGYPTVSAKVDPPIFWLVTRRPENNSQLSVWRKAGEDAFIFTDEETANRVAKAMLHAIELCGGGTKNEAVQNGAEK
jgi:hypothetical protein